MRAAAVLIGRGQMLGSWRGSRDEKSAPVEPGRDGGASARRSALRLALGQREARDPGGRGHQYGSRIVELGRAMSLRPHLNQIIVGVIIDQEGRPVCSGMWPGNTDVTARIPVIDWLFRAVSKPLLDKVADDLSGIVPSIILSVRGCSFLRRLADQPKANYRTRLTALGRAQCGGQRGRNHHAPHAGSPLPPHNPRPAPCDDENGQT